MTINNLKRLVSVKSELIKTFKLYIVMKGFVKLHSGFYFVSRG